MVCSGSLLFSFIFTVLVFAKPLEQPGPSTDLLAPDFSIIPYLFPVLNGSKSSALSTLPSNTSSSETAALRTLCSGEHFGSNPNIRDCESAFAHMAPDSVQYTFGDRHSGLDNTVIPLPYRIMGGRLALVKSYD